MTAFGREANVTINGITLTDAQSMALRVAVDAFLAEMQDPNALGNDETGVAMARGYRDRCGEIRRLIGGAKAERRLIACEPDPNCRICNGNGLVAGGERGETTEACPCTEAQ